MCLQALTDQAPASLTPSSAGGTGRSSSLSQPYPPPGHGYSGPPAQAYPHPADGYHPVPAHGYPAAAQAGYLGSQTSGYPSSQPSSFSSSQLGGYPASHSYPALANGPRAMANGHVPGLTSYGRSAAPLGQSSPLAPDELAYWRRQANQ